MPPRNSCELQPAGADTGGDGLADYLFLSFGGAPFAIFCRRQTGCSRA
jgi:hypothetical protein